MKAWLLSYLVATADELDPGMILAGATAVLGQLLDPWGHPFEYESDGNYYFLKSLGPSGVESSHLTIKVIPSHIAVLASPC